jgi:succinate dehydrogenase/fumarate reductase-like Fe-S protein
MGDKKDFGFGIQAGRQIDLDGAGSDLSRELSAAVSAWDSCINCGSCAATCPSGQNGGLNFRQIHYRIRMLTDSILERKGGALLPAADRLRAIQSCFLCGKCQLVCPRGIPTRYLAIQIMQHLKGYAENIPSL